MALIDWTPGEILNLAPEAVERSYARYRLRHKEAERAMARSLERYGQISPIVVCLRGERLELVDGFKRVAVAPEVEGMTSLVARVIEASESAAKAAIYGLNVVSGHTSEIEEAWIVHALVREDGLEQIEVAELLGRHKSWVSRRLALVERLEEAARDEIAVGLISPSTARHLVRLPRGNQLEVLEAVRKDSLTSAETGEVVDLFLGATGRPQQRFVLEQPREALAQAHGEPIVPRDPRLSPFANEAQKKLYALLSGLSRFEDWLRHRAHAELSEKDRALLKGGFERLRAVACVVAELLGDVFGVGSAT